MNPKTDNRRFDRASGRRCTSGSLQPLALFDRTLIVPAIGGSFRKLDPRTLVKNPVMFVVEIVSVLTTYLLHPRPRDRRRHGRRHQRAVLRPDRGLAVVHRAVRQFRRGGGRGPRQGAGRHACAACAPRPWPSVCQDGEAAELRAGRRGRAQAGRHRAGRDRRLHPERRRGDRGRRLGRRIGHHRRIRAGHPRKRRRPLGGHRRHARDLGLDQGAHHRGAGLDLPRPHDRAGRGRGAAEDAERDRAQHPARRPDASSSSSPS